MPPCTCCGREHRRSVNLCEKCAGYDVKRFKSTPLPSGAVYLIGNRNYRGRVNIRQIKFSKDWKKLDGESFSTIRKVTYYEGVKKGEEVMVVSPRKMFKATCVGNDVQNLESLTDDFLITDTDTKSRQEALATLSRFHITFNSQVRVLDFAKSKK